VPFRRLHHVVLLLAPSRRQVVTLGGAGPALWDLLAEPITIGDAVHRLACAYDVPAESIAPDVHRIVDELARLDVLTRAEP
jgi:coenzyme PQQ synthesis protein D (PqqD)